MDKNFIKNILRESLDEFSVIDEKKEPKKSKKDPKNIEKNVDGTKKDYADVQRAFKKLGGPSMVDIMILALGLPDDDKGVNRSLFRKKVKQVKNKETGSIYQFDDEELTKVRTAIGIKK
jgi:hypothetical protein